MKKLILLLLCITPSFAANVCGPAVSGLDYSYTVEMLDNYVVGYWAIGTGCVGEYSGDITTSCENIVVTGHARCYYTNGVSQIKGTGQYCECTRLRVLSNGQLIDSVGKSLQIVATNRDASICQANCSRMCAEAVINNTNGARGVIMLLPAS